MDWGKLINDLIAKGGLIQTDIARECGVAQSSISALSNGKTKRPNFELGQKLLALHERTAKDTARAA